MWSLGVIVYILLGGYPPFIEQNQRDLFRKIRKGQYEFHEEYWGQVSGDAKELISSLGVAHSAIERTGGAPEQMDDGRCLPSRRKGSRKES